jgi:zinc transporter ZupT
MKLATLRKIVYPLCAFVGLGAVIFGSIMMIFPVNTPLGLSALLPEMRNFPFQMFFQTLFWSGLALFLVNGVSNMIACWFFKRKNNVMAFRFAFLAGILLIIWCTYESLFLPNALVIFYFTLGAAQTAFSGGALGIMRLKADR